MAEYINMKITPLFYLAFTFKFIVALILKTVGIIYITLIQGNVYRSIVYRYVNLKARTHRDKFRARYSPTFNASWLNKGRQCECARCEKRHA